MRIVVKFFFVLLSLLVFMGSIYMLVDQGLSWFWVGAGAISASAFIILMAGGPFPDTGPQEDSFCPNLDPGPEEDPYPLPEFTGPPLSSEAEDRE